MTILDRYIASKPKSSAPMGAVSGGTTLDKYLSRSGVTSESLNSVRERLAKRDEEKKKNDEKKAQYESAVANANRMEQEALVAKNRENLLQGIADLPKSLFNAAKESAAIVGDIATRLSPVEGVRNIVSGARTLVKGEGFQKGFIESQARPLLYEKAIGKTLPPIDKATEVFTNEEYKKAIGRAMEAPTYFYAGAKGLAIDPIGNFLMRLGKRTLGSVPEAGIQTGIQRIEGDKTNLATSFAGNVVAMSVFSNLFGEIGKKFGRKLTPNEEKDVVNAVKSGADADTVIKNIETGEPIKTPKADAETKIQQIVYRGQPEGATQGEYSLFSGSKKRAIQYADLKKDVTGKSEVVTRDISKLKLKDVLASEYLDAMSDPKIKAKYDGVSFKEPGGEQAYAIFNKPPKQPKFKPETVVLTGKGSSISPVIERELGQETNLPTTSINGELQKADSFIATNDINTSLKKALYGGDADNISTTMINRRLADSAGQAGNVDLRTDLVSARAANLRRFGQEIVMERGVLGETSTDQVMKRVLNAKMGGINTQGISFFEKAKSRLMGSSKAATKVAGDAQQLGKEINSKLSLRQSQIETLLNSLECK